MIQKQWGLYLSRRGYEILTAWLRDIGYQVNGTEYFKLRRKAEALAAAERAWVAA